MGATIIFHGLGLVQGGVLRGLGLQAKGSQIVLFSFYVVCLPSAYLYSIYLEMGVKGLMLGITSGSFTFALLNFVLLKFFVSWKRLVRDIHLQMKEKAQSSHHTLLHISNNLSRHTSQQHNISALSAISAASPN